jgi:hypothetical protein
MLFRDNQEIRIKCEGMAANCRLLLNNVIKEVEL